MADTTTKEKIISSLEGKFLVTKVERCDWDEGTYIKCKFMKKGKEGSFEFSLIGGEYGIDEFEYDEYDDDDDVWAEATEWVEENIECEVVVKYEGKKLL